MKTKTKGPVDLFDEVIDQGLCTNCGACIGFCPYQVFYKGKVRRLDFCSGTEGQCYDHCPRTYTNMDAISNKIVGQPYNGSSIGTMKAIFITRAKTAAIRNKGQYGGTVTALLTYVLENGIIDRALLSKTTKEKLPVGFVARNGKEVRECAGSNYIAYPALEALNRVNPESGDRIGIVVTPCQAQALAKMRTYPSRKRHSAENVKLVIGLFCTWAMAYEGFYDFLRQRLDIQDIKKFDIPPPPANTFDVHLAKETRTFSLDEIRKFRMPTCAYCLDMTAELTDISVGSAEGIPGWNTVIVRTDEGARVVETAKNMGIIEIDELPPANLDHLKMASMNKKKRAVSEIVRKTGNRNDMLYLGLPGTVKDDLLSQTDDQGGSADVNH